MSLMLGSAGVLYRVLQQLVGGRLAGRSDCGVGGVSDGGSDPGRRHVVHGAEQMRREVAYKVALAALNGVMACGPRMRRLGRAVTNDLAGLIAIRTQAPLDPDAALWRRLRLFDRLAHKSARARAGVGRDMLGGPVGGRAASRRFCGGMRSGVAGVVVMGGVMTVRGVIQDLAGDSIVAAAIYDYDVGFIHF